MDTEPVVSPTDNLIVRLQHIKDYPGQHVHFDVERLMSCCMVDMGHGYFAVVAQLMDAHQQYTPLGRNGDHNCDVMDGPCNCGAWHNVGREDKTQSSAE